MINIYISKYICVCVCVCPCIDAFWGPQCWSEDNEDIACSKLACPPLFLTVSSLQYFSEVIVSHRQDWDKHMRLIINLAIFYPVNNLQRRLVIFLHLFVAVIKRERECNAGPLASQPLPLIFASWWVKVKYMDKGVCSIWEREGQKEKRDDGTLML